MKHTTKQSNKAKKQLILHYSFKEVDFYQENSLWYLNCKDNVSESAWDVYREKVLTLKEKFEYEMD